MLDLGISVATILLAMALIAGIEVLIPLHARGRWNRAHLGPNLTLTGITFVTNAVMGAALVLALAWLSERGLGLLNAFSLAAWVTLPIVLLGLDLSFYVAHVAMHKLPAFWRFHCVHHSDPAVDVTTTVRQHPGEGVIRYAFTAVFAVGLGASPAAFAVYRLAVALSALAEHANLRLPERLDTALSLVFTWPNLHKVHHSRDARYTDTNYGNLFSWWDRLFGTFTPAVVGASITYGLDGFDDAATQTTAGLLAVPFQPIGRPALSRDSGFSRPIVRNTLVDHDGS